MSSTISSKILNLKFMQRHKTQVEAQQRAAADATARLEAEWSMEMGLGVPAAAASSSASTAAPAAAPSATVAAQSVTASAPAPAPPGRRVVTAEDVPQASEQQQLLQFRPGRRSFGSFNPRLEKRLTEINETKREAAELIELERRAAEERRKATAAHAELVRKADAQEAKERQDGVSEEEMAARYSKYLPTGFQQHAMPEPPVVQNPVRVRDAPVGGGAAAKKRKTQ